MDWQDVQLNPPTRTATVYPSAECPRCKATHEMQIMNPEGKPYNLTCNGCGKKFCSFCQESRHWLGPCPRINRVTMDYSEKKRTERI